METPGYNPSVSLGPTRPCAVLCDYTFLGGTNGTAQWVQQEILRVEHQKCLDLRDTLKQNVSEGVKCHQQKQPRKM